MRRDLLAHAALAQIPKILTLQDRNPHSPTYGCFDRNFWQYKIVDFPSGMSQEFVWPLALAYSSKVDNNSFYQQPALYKWVEAGILYAARSSHSDGSCDDYFPFERAGGAAAFSLLACLESYTLLGLKSPAVLQFFERRADWLAHHHESGRLTNHQALIVLCLELASRLLHTDKWEKVKIQRLERVFEWQNPEGWFQEYEGCDPGYHTLTISCLARLYELIPSNRLRDSIAKAVILASYFVHPDGSYGGEYTSRNTYNFFPHGFELVGRWLPEALSVNDRFLEGLAKGKGACYSDDHIVGHHAWNYLLAWRDFSLKRPPVKSPQTNRLWLPEARILIDQREDTKLYLALNKGGAFKFFRDGHLVMSDTQFSLQVREKNSIKNAVGHLVGNYEIHIEEDTISIAGSLGWAKQKQMTSFNLIVLRIVMFTVGRYFPDLIRKLLQRILITGKENAPYWFNRQFKWQAGQWHLIDELKAQSWKNLLSVGIGSDQTSIHVVMSRTFQSGQLQLWLDLTDKVKVLKQGQSLRIKRQL
ncbi:MAG: hypothetical protein ACFB0E_01435 [Leptolyngbyaceae cyanobacterium]